MNDDELDITKGDFNSASEIERIIKLRIHDVNMNPSIESIEVDNDRLVITASADIINQRLSDTDKPPMKSAIVYPSGYHKYYSKICNYVNSLPKGSEITAYDISEALKIKFKYVEPLLHWMVKHEEMIA